MANPYAHVKRGKRPEMGGVYFRSEAEAQVARFLESIDWEWEYEKHEFNFPIKRGTVTYKPDFKAWPKGSPDLYRWIEVKGWMDAKSQTKLRRFAKYYPDELKRLVIITDWKGIRDWVAKNLNNGESVRIWELRSVKKWAH